MKNLFGLIFCFFAITTLLAQETTFPYNGVQDSREKHYALTNADIFIDADKSIKKGTLVIKEGKISLVDKASKVPNGAVEIDMTGKYIYPSFIELYDSYGTKTPEKPKHKDDKPQYVSNKKGAFGWNQAIKPEINAGDHFTLDAAVAKNWRARGFGSIVSHVADGINRGTGTLVAVSAGPKDNNVILKDKVATFHSFSKGISTQDYPGSLMGTIALIKQTHYDAEWYKKNEGKVEENLTLAAYNENQNLPSIFKVSDRLSLLRAAKLGNEIDKQYIICGSGDEYKRIDEIKASKATVIVPLKFPEAFDVEDPFDAKLVTLAQMKHWEMAPANAAFLYDSDIPFCLTTTQLKDKNTFIASLKKAIKYGLPKKEALRALTETPAKTLDIYDMVGSLEKGKIANFIITSDSLFNKKSSILENWVQGNRYVVEQNNELDLRGKYNLNFGKSSYRLKVSGSVAKPKFQIVERDSVVAEVKSVVNGNLVSLSFKRDKDLDRSRVRLSGWITDDMMEGKGQLSNGKWVDWTASKTGKLKPKKKKDEDKVKKKNEEKKEKELPELENVLYPFVGYGWEKEDEPKQQSVIIKNATVWTNESDGIIENADVVIKNGKISAVGTSIGASADIEIDGTGKHVTAGIIDEHSHIAISRGVNEWTQQSSAEVSIADVINSEDVNIYRQLSGGVTTAQLLHGSANPIGGQSGIIKLRWGAEPEQMKIKDADGFIKFALGENVKQANWGDDNVTRFPQSRMGVEQVFIDHFNRANEYLKAGNNKRKDLELDALAEIIQKQRFITCHSYVQSEITMLMRVAEQFDFKINTFTHILEGYKVADKMKAHGVAGSTFSDWWRYKYEVIDAIPHNGAILSDMDVLTSFNSDDAEMARRLNKEAAKAVKYGAVSEEEALKFVTLNPAKMLHIDDQTGSLKAGKDADVVVWSDHPLSINSKAEQTFVDGILYFDKDQDEKKRRWIEIERNRLIQKMIDHKKGGGATTKPKPKSYIHYHCDTIDGHEEHEEH